MRIDLTSLQSRLALLSVVLCLSGALSFFAGKLWLADHWGAASNSELWCRAARLEPGNADYWRNLGLHTQWTLGANERDKALSYLMRAAQTNPHSAGLWMDLADAYQASGDAAGAQQAYQKAVAAYPVSGEVAWRYGSFLLYGQDLPQGYAELRRALLANPSLEDAALLECWQANPDVNLLMDRALPSQSAYYVTAMDFFLLRRLLDPALAVWKRRLTLKQPVDMAEGIRLVNALIDGNRLAEAQEAWAQALMAAHWPQDRRDGESLVFNGGFEHDLANGGFDWREAPLDGAHFAIDTRVVHSGSRSLQVRFDGQTNADFQHLLQIVFVQPRVAYLFVAYLRTEEISTDQGLRFEIIDPQNPSEMRVLTENITGTTPWSLVRAEFTAGANTRLLQIALRRIPSGKIDSKIRGTVWIDDVSLVPVSYSDGGP